MAALIDGKAARRRARRWTAPLLLVAVGLFSVVPRLSAAGASPWSQSVSQPGGGSRGMAMATGPNGTVVVYGGCCLRLNDGVGLGDGWVRSGSTWTLMDPVQTKPVGGRFYASMAYDAVESYDVMVGGQANGSTLIDSQLGQVTTWLWDGKTWTSILTDGGPAPRTGAAMAYDPVLQEVVLYGGSSSAACCASNLRDTWLWNGVNWTAAPAPPADFPALFGATLAFDPLSQKLILFGGESQVCVATCSPLVDSTDTWTFDGTTWSKVGTSGPPGRHLAGMATAASTCNVLLFGGETAASPTPLGDTWRWDGTWHQQSPSTAPSRRSQVGFALDIKTQNDVLFGGTTAPQAQSGANGTILNETWQYQATATSCAPPPTPTATPTPLQPTLKFDRAVTADGFVVQVTGTNWQPGKPDVVTLTWTVEGGRPAAVQVKALATDGAGGFRTSILIFPHDFAGSRILTGADGAHTATAMLLIVPSPGEPPRYFIRR